MIPMRASPLQLDQIGIDSSQPTARPFDGAKEQIKYLAASPHNMVWKRLRDNPVYQLPSHVERVCRIVLKDVDNIESLFTCFGSNSSDDGVTFLDVAMFFQGKWINYWQGLFPKPGKGPFKQFLPRDGFCKTTIAHRMYTQGDAEFPSIGITAWDVADETYALCLSQLQLSPLHLLPAYQSP